MLSNHHSHLQCMVSCFSFTSTRDFYIFFTWFWDCSFTLFLRGLHVPIWERGKCNFSFSNLHLYHVSLSHLSASEQTPQNYQRKKKKHPHTPALLNTPLVPDPLCILETTICSSWLANENPLFLLSRAWLKRNLLENSHASDTQRAFNIFFPDSENTYPPNTCNIQFSSISCLQVFSGQAQAIKVNWAKMFCTFPCNKNEGV